MDEATRSDDHRLYQRKTLSPTDRMSYSNQFKWRQNTAIAHIQGAFSRGWQAPPP